MEKAYTVNELEMQRLKMIASVLERWTSGRRKVKKYPLAQKTEDLKILEHIKCKINESK